MKGLFNIGELLGMFQQKGHIFGIFWYNLEYFGIFLVYILAYSGYIFESALPKGEHGWLRRV